jgi:hypothetical protein
MRKVGSFKLASVTQLPIRVTSFTHFECAISHFTNNTGPLQNVLNVKNQLPYGVVEKV